MGIKFAELKCAGCGRTDRQDPGGLIWDYYKCRKCGQVFGGCCAGEHYNQELGPKANA